MKRRSTRLQVELLEDRNLPSGTSIASPIIEPIIPVEPFIPLAVVSAPPTVTGPTLHATAGVQFSGVIGFYASPVLDPPFGYSATVKWDDGGSSNATLSFGEYNGQYGYLISATHTFTTAGIHTVTVALLEGPINPASKLPSHIVEYFVDKAIVKSSTAVHILASAGPLLEIHEPAQQLVIRNAAQLKADTGLSEAGLAAMLKIGSINWKTQMLVVVTAGFGGIGFLSPRPNITSLIEQGGTLTVHWDSVEQNPKQPIPQYVILGNPAEVVLTSRLDGSVHFQFDGTVVLPLPKVTVSP